MFRKSWHVALVAASVLAVLALSPPSSFARPEFFTANCAGCHSNDTPTCIGCHHHGGANGSPGTASTDKAQYAPGETITVSLTGSSRGVWARALLYDQTNREVARITGPTGMGDDGTNDPRLQFPFTLQAPAPTTPGTYTWEAAWWGSPYDTNNSTAYPHGPEVRRTTNQFTVAAPVVTGTVAINAGAAYTNTVAVTLAITVSGSGVTQMRFSNDNATWSAWEAYGASKAWSLAAGDGSKTVYAQFGNASGTVLANASDAIALDATAPTGSLLINSGATSTSSAGVTLTLSATDGGSGVSDMQFSNDGATWTAWEPYAASKAWTLVPGDGLKTVSVKYRDRIGNVSVAFSASIQLVSPPASGTVNINNGQTYTNSTAVTLSLTITGPGVTQVRFSNDNAAWSAWEAFAASKPWTLTAGDGRKTVYAQFGNAGGTVVANAYDTITLDATAPTGGLTINGGAAYTNSLSADLALAATDAGSGVTQMRFSADNAVWTGWEAFAASRVYALAAGDGPKTVYAQYRDAAGNVSASYSDSIILDMTGPSGQLQINGGALATSQSAVSLAVSAVDAGSGNSQMHFSNDNAVWSAWEAYATSKAWTLPAGDGLKTIYAQFRDALGNSSAAYSDIVILDTHGPTGRVSINNGAPRTNLTTVTLALAAQDAATTVTRMRFGNSPGVWTAWQNYAATCPWNLPPGDGVKTVYAQFGDLVGNASGPTSATILLDTTPSTGTPGSLLINGGAAFTNSLSVSLGITGPSGAAQMQFSNDGTTWSGWEPFAPTKTWTLEAGDGVKNVYVRFADGAGADLGIAGDDIRLDLTAPSGTILINDGADYARTAAATLALTATDAGAGVSQMRFSNDNTTWTGWEAFGASKAWTLPAGDGSKTVYVQFQDALGNASSAVQDSIVLDGAGPSGSISINGGAANTRTVHVTLALSAADAGSGVARMRLSNSYSTWGPWQNYAAQLAWDLAPGDGAKTVYVQFQDRAGNGSARYSARIILDASGPRGSIRINGGAAFTNSIHASLELAATDAGSGVAQMRLSNSYSSWGPWQAYAARLSWDLAPGDGPKAVYVQFKDRAGNTSDRYSARITLDATPPTGRIVINGGASSTRSSSVQLTLAASDTGSGVARMRFSNDGVSWTSWQTYATSRGWTLPGSAGLKTVSVQFKDRAGNVSPRYSDTIQYSPSSGGDDDDDD